MNAWRVIIRSWILWYALLAAGLTFLINSDIAMSRRLDYLNHLGVYPISYYYEKHPEDGKRTLWLTTKYYSLLSKWPSTARLYRTWEMLGLCYFLLGEQERSLTFLNKALEINPRAFWLEYNRGVLLSKTGNWEQGLLSFNEILRMDEEDMLNSSVFFTLRNALPEQINLVRARNSIFITKIRIASARAAAELTALIHNRPSRALHEKDAQLPVEYAIHPWSLIPVGFELQAERFIK